MICSRCKVDQPEEAFARNKAKASGFNSYCRNCMRSYAAARRQKSDVLERDREAQRRYRTTLSLEERRARHKAWRDKNPGYYVERTKAWRAANPGARKEHTREYYERNRAYYHAKVAERRARQQQALPPWADLKAIREIYKEAGRRNAAGEKVHVDHVVPLIHPDVCGLHVEANLKIIPALDNWAKNNRHWPNMP